MEGQPGQSNASLIVSNAVDRTLSDTLLGSCGLSRDILLGLQLSKIATLSDWLHGELAMPDAFSPLQLMKKSPSASFNLNAHDDTRALSSSALSEDKIWVRNASVI